MAFFDLPHGFETLKKKSFTELVKVETPSTRAQQDWAFKFPDQTGPDTQICQTGPGGPD